MNNENKTNINWYPGHMAKTKRLINEKLSQIDIIYEMVDARIPFSSKISDIDEYIKNKPRILIMSKYDLCDSKETKKWKQYYEERGYTVLLIDQDTNPNIIIKTTKNIMESINKNNSRKYRALIIGIPNVGKSTLINKLVGKKAVNVGNKPGITKNLNWIRINEEIDLLDTPGILWPKFETEEIAYNLASLTAIKEEILPTSKVACYILRMLYNYYPSILNERYGLKTLDDDFIEAFETIGKKRGCLIKGGEVDYDKVSLIIMNDIKNGFIKGITFDRISVK